MVMIDNNLWLPKELLPTTIAFDVEQCGVFIGKRGWLAQQLVLLENQHEDPEHHYAMYVPPRLSKKIVAIFHSHTIYDNALPSDHDMEVSAQLKVHGVIVTPDRTACVYRGWKVIKEFTY
jgi:proteasome lid subunit RPN8/RPN11